MKFNSNTKIVGTNVLLVPYEKHHVPKYHTWMTNKELQKLTASEPLTLEQEYEMQKSWREDDDKCTFIVLHREKFNETNDEVESMIGDTNIFITDEAEGVGEIEIMIAEDWARRQKLGWQTVVLMLLYGIQHIHLSTFEAKISLSNEISIQMFKKLGFVEKSVSDVFQEVTFEKPVDDDWRAWLLAQCVFEIQAYH
ncbi:N-acetyltransferase 9-like protein isoform X1 [Ostrinia furnacalis]|uniref:N-acetyltransferase 9-like protein isoform X1 n=1 Tax=Ostrinia furnacalis TaxID=93504 RepID=UPI00103F5625|nr:N-acetyltransferase 9-like protein isoform X1 [Ostrinia furnacalis]